MQVDNNDGKDFQLQLVGALSEEEINERRIAAFHEAETKRTAQIEEAEAEIRQHVAEEVDKVEKQAMREWWQRRRQELREESKAEVARRLDGDVGGGTADRVEVRFLFRIAVYGRCLMVWYVLKCGRHWARWRRRRCRNGGCGGDRSCGKSHERKLLGGLMGVLGAALRTALRCELLVEGLAVMHCRGLSVVRGFHVVSGSRHWRGMRGTVENGLG